MLDYIGVKKIWLKEIGLVLLLIAINGVSMASEKNGIGMIIEESREESEESDSVENEKKEYIEKVKVITENKGIFSVVITNAGSKVEIIEVSLNMINPPLGCKNLGHLNNEKLEWLYLNVVRIMPHEVMTIELPIPFISPQDDLEQYDNIDNLLPLSENSEITIKIISIRNTMGIIRLPEYKKVFKAKYLPGTRLIELPKKIPITIDYDNDRYILEPNPEFGFTQEAANLINAFLGYSLPSLYK